MQLLILALGTKGVKLFPYLKTATPCCWLVLLQRPNNLEGKRGNNKPNFLSNTVLSSANSKAHPEVRNNHRYWLGVAKEISTGFP